MEPASGLLLLPVLEPMSVLAFAPNVELPKKSTVRPLADGTFQWIFPLNPCS